MTQGPDLTTGLPGGFSFQDDPEDDEPGRRWLRRTVKIIGILALVLVVAAAGVVFALWRHLDNNVKRIDNVFAGIPQGSRPAKAVPDAENFLLVGSDSRASAQTTGAGGDPGAQSSIGQRSDTIMLLHLAADRESAALISIPRDSWVPIPGHGTQKINAAFAFGGPAMLIRTVEQLSGVRIDHFAEVDFAGFKAMTDAVGGVDVDVAEPFVGAHHQFTAGTNHLDGDAALAFVRERHSLPRGDFDRIQHQQQFLKALMAKTTSHGELTDPVGLTRLLDAVTRSVSVDSELSGGDLRSLAFSVRTLRGGAVKTLTVPNAGTGRVGAASVVFLDAARDRVVFAAVREDRVASITP